MTTIEQAPPVVIEHEGVHVVRDDLFPGGTKARYFAGLFEQHDHVVYATPAEGGAQTALAAAAKAAGKDCTIFVAKRAVPHDRALMAKALGATVVQVPHGYLNVVQAKAAEFCRRTGAFNLPFGGAIEGAQMRIAEAAAMLDLGLECGQVWCAAGSGTLASGLRLAFPEAEIHMVQVGRDVRPVSGQAEVHSHRLRFGQASRAACPFPSDPHYDRKAWEMCAAQHDPGRRTLFWNVTGPAEA